MHLREIWPVSLQDWLFAASFLVPPVLNGIAWWRRSKPAESAAWRSGLAATALFLNTAAVAATSLVVLAVLATAIGGTPSGLPGQFIAAAATFVIGASLVSAVFALFARSELRIVLVPSSLLAWAFWPLLLAHISIG